ncbi:hypothetical protein SR870_14985 [Rhodopseudomonas palustris]|uniref:hypothetical protein n=1 Tax=Rhodopseudomonas palustris TaxID=1076 RepID=UPI002ACF03B8|nr:hypothetical protein [Rhodopseudomonas palustris]WQG98005.1 hypothetical protein SR870_14985 [Rhodopseudomonas palustris]
MRTVLTIAFLAAAAPAAHAAPLVAPDAMRTAIAAASPVETVACVRGGWRGPGVYPGCRAYRPGYPVRPYRYYARPVAPYYVAPRVVVAGPPVVVAPRSCWIAGAWRPC